MHPSSFRRPAALYIAAVAAALLLPSVQATTWYVDPSAPGLGHDGTSAATAWLSLSAINQSLLNAGDVVLIRPGTYTGQFTITKGGTGPAARITYKAASGAVLQGGIALGATNYVAIIGFEITQPVNPTNYSAITMKGASGCLIENNYIHDTYLGGIEMGELPNPQGSNDVIRANHFSNIGGTGGGVGQGGTTMQIRGTGHVVEYNQIDTSLDRVTLIGSANVVRNNYYSGTDTARYASTSPYPFHTDGLQPYSPTRQVLYERNWDMDNRDTIGGATNAPNGHGVIFQSTSGTSDQIVIRFNAMIRDAEAAALFSGYNTVFYYNNTHVAIGVDLTSNFNSAFVWQTAGSDLFDLRNNTWDFMPHMLAPSGIVSNVNTPTHYTHGTEHAFNLGAQVILTSGASPTNLGSVDPKFVDGTGVLGHDNYNLQSTSPLKGAGSGFAAATTSGTNSTTLTVTESRGFFDGWSIPGVDSDLIKIGSQPYVRIASINYSTNTITLSAARSWNAGDAVIVKGMEDIGALPYAYATPLSVVNTTAVTLPTTGTVNLTATVGDANTVRGVEFLVDGIPVGIAYDPAPNTNDYSVSWPADGNASHNVEARAYNSWASESLWVSDFNTSPRFSTNPGQTPANPVVPAGTVVLSASATSGDGSSLAYRWQHLISGTWTNLSDGGQIAGAATATLTISGITTANAGDYRVIAANDVDSETSSTATVVVGVPPAIATQPTSQTTTYKAVTPATFTAGVTGTPMPAVQWQFSSDGGITWNNLANGAQPSGSTVSGATATTLQISSPRLADAGQYQLIASNTFSDATVHSVSSATVTLTVNKKTLSISSIGVSNKTYDGTTAATIVGNSAQFPLGAIEAGDTVAVDTSAASASFQDPNVGTGKAVTITGLALTGASAANYQLSSTSAASAAAITALTVTPGVTAGNKVYDGTTAATITARNLSGVIPADAANVSLTGGIATFSDAAAGSGKTVTVTGLSLTGGQAVNYALSSTSATTSAAITPAPATVALSNTTQVYNGGVRTVTVSTTPPGLSVAITYNGSPTAPSGGGTYTVSAAVTDPNYTGSTAGSLTISPAPQSITFAALATKTIGDPDFVLTATSTSGLAVTYASSDPTVATIISGNTVHIVAPGSTTITATQVGNANYSAAPAVPQTLTVLGTPPSFTQQPTPSTKTVAPSGVASFAVAVSGIPTPALRWQFSTDGGTTWNDVPNLTPYAGITTATLQIVGAQQGEDGYLFRCIATNILNSATSTTATFHVNVNAPLFTTNPTNQTVTEGTNTSWTVVATGGAPLTLQWQVSNDGVTWAPLAEAAPYTGTTTATLAITGTPLSLNGKKYRCVATNALDACTSFVATLTVNPLVPVTSAPVIWEDPVNRIAALGGSAIFSVSGTGSPAPTAQWRHNGVAIAGATNLALALANVQLADAGSYDVVLSNSVGAVTSKPATLTIDSSPIITSQPTGASAVVGTSVTFTVAAQGITPLSYQWRKNGVAIAAANGTTLTLANVQLTDAAAYDVVVTNSLGTTTSASALLAVNAKSYAGQYFGTLSGGGTWALNVKADNTGTFIAYLPDRSTAIVTNIVIDASGSFSASTSEIGTSGTSALSVNGLYRPVAASLATLSLSGTITGGQVTGSVGGINESLTGNVDIGVASDAGYYKAVALGTTQASTYAVVGASGKTLVVTATPTTVDSLSGTVDASGALKGTTVQGAALRIAINPQTEALAATYSSTTSPALQFSGLSSSVASTTHVVNLSARAAAGTGSGTLIVGFTVAGTGQKSLLIRGVGPALAAYGIAAPLADPVLSVYSGQTLLTSNDNWSNDVNAGQAATVAQALNAFPLTSGGLDAALLTNRDPGVYTAVVSGNGTANGVALAEIYDAAASSARLTNVSARGQVGTGANVMIIGFVVAGNAPKQYLVRAIGPSLTQFNVTGVLANPQLSVVQQGTSTVLAQNDDWAGTAALQAAFTTVNAFGLDPASKDAAALVTLAPGNYSLVVSGVANTTGVALVEVYEIP